MTRNRHGNYQYLVSNARQTDLTTLALRQRSRWSVETVFRDTEQFAGLGACQCWVDQAMVRHVGVVLLAFVVLQRLRLSPEESLAAVKERWQLTALQDGQAAPPLRACPRVSPLEQRFTLLGGNNDLTSRHTDLRRRLDKAL